MTADYPYRWPWIQTAREQLIADGTLLAGLTLGILRDLPWQMWPLIPALWALAWLSLMIFDQCTGWLKQRVDEVKRRMTR